MSTYTPTTGAQFLTALTDSQAGDDILLLAGTAYEGEFQLSAKTGVVTVRPLGGVPDRRITDADVPLLPTLRSGTNAPVLTGFGAANWHIDGVNLEPTAGFLGGEAVILERAHNVTFDRIRLVSKGGDIKRGIRGNGTLIMLIRSHIAGIWRPSQDSQAFCAWNGAGPYTLTNNLLQAAGENVMFGGADSASPEDIPSDILVLGNHITKDSGWKTAPEATVKNLFELKCARRVEVKGNLFAQHWADDQSGRAIVLTPRNQDGAAPWSVVEDVQFIGNTLRDVPMGVGILGHDDVHPSQQTTGIVFRDNDFEADGMMFMVLNEVGRVDIYRNRLLVPVNAMLLYVAKNEGAIRLPDGTQRTSQFAADHLVWAENDTPNGYIHAPDGRDEQALKLNTRSYSFVVPSAEPTGPEPPSEPEPPADIVGPDVRLAVLHRQGKSHNWELRADSDAADVVKVEFYVNGEVKRTMITAPFGTTLSLKGYRGSVSVAVQAWDAAGNIGTASRTVVL